MREDLTWFWTIVDKEGFANVPSSEQDALRILSQKASERDALREENARLMELIVSGRVEKERLRKDVSIWQQHLINTNYQLEKEQKEITRLREAVKSAYYEGWTDNASREYTRQEIHKDWKTSEAFDAIREGGKDE